jgi:flagellar biosynthesis GTPase FlhF
MMIKCQKCGFENQMGSIFCRECGEKLDMDAIDPNKLQKDVDKEKNIKRAKKRLKEAISTGFGLLVVAAFLGVVFYNGGLRQYEEPAVTEAAANQKFNAAATGTVSGKVKYTYPEITRMFNTKVVAPLSELDSFAKVTNAEITYDAEKNQPVIYLWISLKDKVPVIYTIHGNLVFNPPSDTPGEVAAPLTLDVKRLDIGRLPVFVSTHSFLDGFATLIDNGEVGNFFARARSVEFDGDGMTVEFGKGGGSSSYVPQASAAAGVAALKGGSTAALSEKEEKARAKAEAAKQKAAEEKEKQKQLEEERKRKAEEYRQQQKEKEEERKRKLEEEKERKKQEKEERERQIREENERRRQEREDRRRDRQNNNYNSRSSRSSRNRY